MKYNRVLKKADYEEFGVTTRKAWEIEMALKTLRDNGATSPEALLVGVGAGRERTIFDLANEADCRQVVATDIYNEPGSWGGWHGRDFILHTAKYVPEWADARRVLVRHADMRELPFPDAIFDGVFSSGSIEHVGTEGKPNWDAIARCANEIARVVKPGGIISISTEWRLAGEGWGWANCVLFHENNIYPRLINEFTDCELIDEPDWSFDGDYGEAIVLSDLVNGRDRIENHPMEYVLREHQFTYTSVHLALRKKGAEPIEIYPEIMNDDE